jgi:plastocyanin
MRLLLVAALVAAIIPAPSPAADAPPVSVHIRDDKFVPATLTITAGRKVTFVNDDDAHTVTADDGSWDSEGLNQGQAWSRAFPRAGKIAYHCTVHPFMKGTLIVKAATP